MKLFPTIGLLLCLALAAHGASYYVDYSAGSDAAAGTATGTAWKHCPGDTNATDTALSTTLNAGDTVYFKGGVSYVLAGQGIVVSSGTAGSPVTYDGNSAGGWGTGMAVITDSNSTNNITAFISSGSISNVIFKALKFTNIGGGTLPADPGYAITKKPGHGIVATSMINVLMDGCYFGQLGYYQHLNPVGNSSLEGTGIGSSAGCNGLTITNCEFTQIRSPISLSLSGNILNTTITKCSFHDQMEWAIMILHDVTTYRSNLVISSCTFSNTDQYYVAVAQGGQWTGYGDGPHQNSIMMYGAEGGGGSYGLDRVTGDTNVFIYNNYFVNTLGYPGGSTGIWLQDGVSGHIYNNVFNMWTANNEININGDFTNTPFFATVFNNTIYGPVTHINVSGTAAFANAWTLTATGALVLVENNVLSALGIGNQNNYVYMVQTPTNTFTQFTNNVFFNYNSYNGDQTLQQAPYPMVFGIWSPFHYIYTNYAVETFGWDLNSLVGNPLFVRASTNNPAANNLALLTNSPAIGAGVNLTAYAAANNLPGLTTDFVGNARPAVGAWTMGAYENGTNAPAPATPKLILQINGGVINKATIGK